jgi:polysaccharide biosynthesis/export protein
MRQLLLLVALCLWSATATAQSQADPSTGSGTFVTPGYGTSGTASRPSAMPGQILSTPGAQSEGPHLRTPTTPSMRRDETTEPGTRRLDLTPAKPSEFQKFVETATGRRLQVFGSSFFMEAALSQGPMDSVPVSADYVIGPGDELIIRAWGAIDVDYRAQVDRNGQIHLPKVGSFNVAGVRASDIERHLRSQVGRVFTNFNLNVTLGQLRGLKVFVVGPALRPGVYTLPSQSTMLSAAVAAGGPGPNGSMRRLLLRRDGQVVSELDIYDFLVQGDKSRDVQLMPGDVVVFQPVGPRVALTGTLETPAIYELKSAQEPLREVLRYAGGAPVLANPSRGQLERIDPAQPQAPRLVQEFKLDEPGLGTALRDGDVVTLLEMSPQFANAVTLKGHVAQPLRYPYAPGMRIRDLIPDKEALISRDFYRRKNMLVQVIEEEDEFDLATRRTAPGSTGARMGLPGAMQNGQNGTTPSPFGANQGSMPMATRNGAATGGAASGAAVAGMPQPWSLQEPQPQDGTTTRRLRRVARGRRGHHAHPATQTARAIVRRTELGLCGHRAPQPQGPEHAGDSLQPRTGHPARRPRAQRRVVAGRRGHRLQPEGHARAGGATDAARLAGR